LCHIAGKNKKPEGYMLEIETKHILPLNGSLTLKGKNLKVCTGETTKHLIVWYEDEWISVNDRLPEEGLRVLVYAKDGARRGQATAYQLDKVWWGGIWGDQKEPHIDLNDECFEVPDIPTRYITHWMPLPEPPK
jgi:hypothetical protein